MKIKRSVEVWLNGKYLFTTAGFEFKLTEKLLSPDLAEDSTKFGPVVKFVQTEPTTHAENEASAKEMSKRDFDAFYKQMVKRVGDSRAHKPLR